MTDQSTALRLADILDEQRFAELTGNNYCKEAAAELRRLHTENERLRTVMIASAEEIHSHWDAHCDSEGYGPVNLMHRLEKGIASEYGYTVGAFTRQEVRIATLETASRQALEALESCATLIDSEWGECRSLDEMQETHSYPPLVREPITALRDALEGKA